MINERFERWHLRKAHARYKHHSTGAILYCLFSLRMKLSRAVHLHWICACVCVCAVFAHYNVLKMCIALMSADPWYFA